MYLTHKETVIHKYYEFSIPPLQHTPQDYFQLYSCIAKKILTLESIFRVHDLPLERPSGLRHNFVFKSREKKNLTSVSQVPPEFQQMQSS